MVASERKEAMSKEASKVCDQPDCKGEVIAKGKCAKHYLQMRRGRLGKTRPMSPEGEGAEVSFRCHADLKKAIRRLAKTEKREASELWREAAALLLRARALRASKS